MKDRIRAEREALNLAPWQFAPSEVTDDPNPYPQGCAGHAAWVEAQAMKTALARLKREGEPK